MSNEARNQDIKFQSKVTEIENKFNNKMVELEKTFNNFRLFVKTELEEAADLKVNGDNEKKQGVNLINALRISGVETNLTSSLVSSNESEDKRNVGYYKRYVSMK